MKSIKECIEFIKGLTELSEEQISDIETIIKSGDISEKDFETPQELIDELYNFKGEWKSLHDLIWNEYKNKEIWIYTMYPSGEESRKVWIKSVDKRENNPYCFVDVKFMLGRGEENELSQSTCAWSKRKLEYSPFRNEQHKKIWREIVQNCEGMGKETYNLRVNR